jgi:protein ImuA
MTTSFDKAAAALRRSAAPPSLVPLGAPCLEVYLGGGLRAGTLHEVFARDAASAGAAAGFASGLALCAAQARRLLWVRQDFAAREYGEVSASGLGELGLDPDRVVLIRAPDALAALRVAQEALGCAGLGAVIAELYGAPKLLDLTASRRLVLAAGKKSVTAFLLRHAAPLTPSAAETRWIVSPARSAPGEEWGRPRLDVALARNRHGLTGQFTVEWRDGLFHDATTPSRAVVSAPADRPPAAPLRRSA